MRRELCLIPLAAAFSLTACDPTLLQRGARQSNAAPVMDRASTSAVALASDVELLQKLAQSPPAAQAEMLTATQREYELAPTPPHQLRFALVLAAPGHAATDLPRAQQLLRELMAAPESLLPGERALAFLELQKVDAQLSLVSENRRLQSSASHEDRDKLTSINKRLQTETEENARLHKELDEARAKLDAITNIERSLNERKPSTEGHTP